jgi:hypothetical protein
VRKKLKLDQREAAAIFGGGINAFSRHEAYRRESSLKPDDLSRCSRQPRHRHEGIAACRLNHGLDR